MSTLVATEVVSISDAQANANVILALLRQQLRWGLLEAEHPDINMGDVYATQSAVTECAIIVDGVVYDDCKLESFSWQWGGYTLVFSYDLDYKQVDGSTPRKLILATLTLDKGVPVVTFGDKISHVREDDWKLIPNLNALSE